MLMNRKYKLGNILDKPVKDILEKCCIDKKLINDVNRQDKCKKCEFRYFCGGGCRARAFLLTGNTSSVDPFCEMYKEFYHDTILSIIECLTNKS
ncbi:MAG: SPASM domain-containing protein [Intestinibaculum porci]|uniref:SPASM domain-containing protein n=1 Tax=Intestinibaculum porci TaxID=2487118 RepID=UPI003F10C850